MKTLQEIREAAKTKLTGYTEKELESFVQGAMYMAGQLPERKSDEWYQQQEQRRTEGAEKSERLSIYLQHVTGLKQAVDSLHEAKSGEEVLERAFNIFLDDAVANPELRKLVLKVLEAVDRRELAEMKCALKVGLEGFNECHTTQLNFCREEHNGNRWTFSWDEPSDVDKLKN